MSDNIEENHYYELFKDDHEFLKKAFIRDAKIIEQVEGFLKSTKAIHESYKELFNHFGLPIPEIPEDMPNEVIIQRGTHTILSC